MNIVTYHSTNAKPHEAWLAYVVLPSGEQWLVRFHGATEQQAIDAAKARWESEQRRYGYDKDGLPLRPGQSYAPVKKYNELATVDDQSALTKQGRGSHAAALFAGKVWVINRTTHDLKRIDPSELANYEANGYVRGGPRSK